MHGLKGWFLATRPWSFTMSTISVSVGAGLAALDGPFSWGWFLLTWMAMVLLHAGSNLTNDYFDVTSGVDRSDVATIQYRPHPLAEGHISMEGVFWLAIVFFALASIMGLIMVAARGWPVLVIGIVGLLAGVTYTAPPFQYKYRAWGELAVFLMWGPLAVEGAYFVQRQAFSLTALWVSLPFGVLVALVLLANNLRDVESDHRSEVRTLPMLLGGKLQGRLVFIGLVVLAYLAVMVMAIFGPLSSWSLLVLLSAPLAVHLILVVFRMMPRDADARMAKLNTVFGVLLLLSLVLERWT